MMQNLHHKICPPNVENWIVDDGPWFASRSLIAKLVRTAPHACDVPGCPGPENKRKLEAFEGLLVLLRRSLPYLKVCSRNDINAYSENDPYLYEEAGAAVAKADLMMPSGPGKENP